jgi:hypothetical protein
VANHRALLLVGPERRPDEIRRSALFVVST